MGYDSKPDRRNDDVTEAVEGDNVFNGFRHTKRNDGGGHGTAENDHYAGGDSTPNELSGDRARGTYNPPGKIGGYVDSVAGTKNPAYAAPTAAGDANIVASFQKGLKGNKGVG